MPPSAERLFVRSHIYAISLGCPSAILRLLLMGAFLPGLGPADANGASFSVPFGHPSLHHTATPRRTLAEGLEPTAPDRIDLIGMVPPNGRPLWASPPSRANEDGEAHCRWSPKGHLRTRDEGAMNPTDPYHTPASVALAVPPLEAPMPRDTRALIWVAGLLFCATVWTASRCVHVLRLSPRRGLSLRPSLQPGPTKTWGFLSRSKIRYSGGNRLRPEHD
jgi:hypothetical protein